MVSDGELGSAEREELATRLRRAHHDLERATRGSRLDAIAATPMTPQQVRVVGLLALDGPRRLADVAVALGVSPATVTGLVDRLEHQGMVRRAVDPHDGRGKLVQTTEAGFEALRALISTSFPTPDDLTDRLELDQLRAVADAMRVLADVAVEALTDAPDQAKPGLAGPERPSP
ncbi:MAG: MarR family transcriptional regulator [Bifidobacteriaceae bacterium]|jgi:DNA-binding MarR family transcriptional regulator|nr:MarR family transcriptional regulator [Bifidobacteriaceae bacterium]